MSFTLSVLTVEKVELSRDFRAAFFPIRYVFLYKFDFFIDFLKLGFFVLFSGGKIGVTGGVTDIVSCVRRPLDLYLSGAES